MQIKKESAPSQLVKVEASLAKIGHMEQRLERVGTMTLSSSQKCVADVKRNTFGPLLQEQVEDKGCGCVENIITGYGDGRQILRDNSAHPNGSQALMGMACWSSGVPQASRHITAVCVCDGGESGLTQCTPKATAVVLDANLVEGQGSGPPDLPDVESDDEVALCTSHYHSYYVLMIPL